MKGSLVRVDSDLEELASFFEVMKISTEYKPSEVSVGRASTSSLDSMHDGVSVLSAVTSETYPGRNNTASPASDRISPMPIQSARTLLLEPKPKANIACADADREVGAKQKRPQQSEKYSVALVFDERLSGPRKAARTQVRTRPFNLIELNNP